MKRAALVILAAAAIGPGCGGDGGEEAGRDVAAARAEYIERADALCRDIMGYLDGEFASKLDRLDRQAEASGHIERFFARYARVLEEAADRTQRHIERVATLKPPPGSEEVHEAIVGALRTQQYLFRREAGAWREGQLEYADALAADIEKIDEEIERVVRDYGFVDCARPG